VVAAAALNYAFDYFLGSKAGLELGALLSFLYILSVFIVSTVETMKPETELDV